MATPRDLPVRFVAGLYQQPPRRPNGCCGTEYLLDEEHVDRDSAVSGEATWDITSKLSVRGGFRRFKFDNPLEGYYGEGRHDRGTAGQECF